MTSKNPDSVFVGSMVKKERRHAGYKTVDDLASQIAMTNPDTSLTGSKLANIENGRKKEVAFIELSDIARAIGVPLACLICDTSQPFEDAKLSAFKGLTNLDVCRGLLEKNFSPEGSKIREQTPLSMQGAIDLVDLKANFTISAYRTRKMLAQGETDTAIREFKILDNIDSNIDVTMTILEDKKVHIVGPINDFLNTQRKSEMSDLRTLIGTLAAD